MAAAAIDDLTYLGLEKRAHGRVRNDDFTIIGRMRAHFAAFEAAIKVNVSLVGIFKKFKELEGELTKELSFEYFKLCLYRIRHPEKNKAYPRKKLAVPAATAAPVPATPVAPTVKTSVTAPVVKEAGKKPVDDGDFPDPVLTPEQIAMGLTPWHLMTPKQKAARRKKESEEWDKRVNNKISPLLMRVLNKQQENK